MCEAVHYAAESVEKLLGCVTIQMKAIVSNTSLFKVVLTFVYNTLNCEHSNESYWAVISCGTAVADTGKGPPPPPPPHPPLSLLSSVYFAAVKAFVSLHYRFDRASNVEKWVSITSELDYPCKVYSSQVITSITVRYQCRILHATQTVENVVTRLCCFVRLWENSKFVSRQLEKIGIFHNS